MILSKFISASIIITQTSIHEWLQDKDFAMALFLMFNRKYSNENYSSQGKNIWVFQYFVEVSVKFKRVLRQNMQLNGTRVYSHYCTN